MRSAEIAKALRTNGLTQGELASRAGIARETLSRWESGAQHPSLESLHRLARAAGQTVEVRVLPAERKLVEQVYEQPDLPPTKRLRGMLGNAWPRCRDALRAAATLADLGVLVGPVAAALSGAPQRPGDGRVDLLVPPEGMEQAFDRLIAVDAWPDGFEWASEGGERRERWRAGRGTLTMRSAATGVQDIAELCDRALLVALNHSGQEAGVVRVPLLEDLAELMSCSPWGQDAVYRAGLRAVLASGRYSRREHDEQRVKAA